MPHWGVVLIALIIIVVYAIGLTLATRASRRRSSPPQPAPQAVPSDVSHNRYTMTFVFSTDLRHVVLLLKPVTHRNPLFRGKWTAPGGLVEWLETEQAGALRELREETRLEPASLRFVLRFSCNCDPQESVHEVFVYATTMPLEELRRAKGDDYERVEVFLQLPAPLLWTTLPLLELAKARMRQP